jgi:putative tryptophan/tyrosine transport system substrate-binding protein
MRRRELLALLGGAGVMPRVAGAQRKTMPVIGYLGNTPGNPLSFLRGLSEAGYAVEENVRIEYRWAQGRYDRLPALAAELVERKVDVIVSILGPTGTLAAKGATSIIPIVFLSGDDPVERGLCHQPSPAKRQRYGGLVCWLSS